MRRTATLVTFLAILCAVIGHAADTLDVYFIDVGQGDAILIDCGDWEALLDAGRGYSATNAAVLAVLEEHVVDGIIELAILSHPRADHYGGFQAVFNQYEVWEFWRSFDTEPDTSGLTYSYFLNALSDEKLIPQLLECGDRSMTGRIEWVVLGPGEVATGSKNDNENSLVLLLSYGDVSFLFVGDIESYGETALLGIDLPQGPLVLKVANHGSGTSTTTEFLAWADPDLAVISTGYENVRAIGPLSLLEIPFSTTQGAGTIAVSTDGQAIWVSTDALSGQVVDCSEE